MTRTLTPWAARLPRLADFEVEFPKWMAEVFGEGALPGNGKFLPEANLVETDRAVEVTVELPGMKPEEVKVEVKGEQLWISGEKKEEKEESGKTFHRVERRSGAFRRIFSLPAEVMTEKVEAHFTNGVLKITLPKAEKIVPRRIEVRG